MHKRNWDRYQIDTQGEIGFGAKPIIKELLVMDDEKGIMSN